MAKSNIAIGWKTARRREKGTGSLDPGTEVEHMGYF